MRLRSECSSRRRRAADAKGERMGVGAEGVGGERCGGFIDFLPRGPVTRFVGPSCAVIGCSFPRREDLDAPQNAPGSRKSPIVPSIVRLGFLPRRYLILLLELWLFYDSEADLPRSSATLVGKVYVSL